MLTPTHLAAGYLLGERLASAAARSEHNDVLGRRVLLFTMLFAIAPDLDLLWFGVQHHWTITGDSAGAHHAYLTHVPLIYILGAAFLWLGASKFYRWLIAASLVGAISHMLLDSILIGWGIPWLYPFSNRLIGWNIVTRLYRSEWGDHWLSHYLVSPFILVEYAFIAVALFRWQKVRKNVKHEHETIV